MSLASALRAKGGIVRVVFSMPSESDTQRLVLFKSLGEGPIDPLERSHTAPKFAAADPGETARWYVEHLEFPHHAVFENGSYAIVRRGNLTLHLWKCENPIIAENTSCYVELRDVRVLDDLHASLIKKSKNDGFAPGRIQQTPIDAPGHGMREFHVWDPNGNLIGFGAEIKEP